MTVRRAPLGFRNVRNPPVSRWLHLVTLAETLVLMWGGAVLFVAFGFAKPLWPWDLTPFNARFLGAYYLGGAVAAGLMAAVGRWAPARVVIRMTFVFTTIVLIASFVHIDEFLAQRWTTWLWFGLYVAFPAVTGAALWAYRGWPPAQAVAVPPPWRAVLLIEAAVLGAY